MTAGETPAAEAACLGEALVLLESLDDAEPGTVPPTAALAGAEANVAASLAAMGIRSAWVGRVGDDAFGRFVRQALTNRGVRVDAVQVDPTRPTGYYDKVTEAGGTEPVTRMRYHRAGSAASACDPAFLGVPAVAQVLGGARLIHTSGITATLSPGCAAMMRALLGRPRTDGAILSFDVNWREQLWPDGDPSTVGELADLADIVLVGADEALRVFGTEDPSALRQRLPHPDLLLVKDGARRATVIDRAGASHSVPALNVDVVEPVGAGDAFAAGFLSASLAGDGPERRLRRGHIQAAAVLTIRADSAPPPPPAVVETLLACSAQRWAGTTVSADGFAVPHEP